MPVVLEYIARVIAWTVELIGGDVKPGSTSPHPPKSKKRAYTPKIESPAAKIGPHPPRHRHSASKPHRIIDTHRKARYPVHELNAWKLRPPLLEHALAFGSLGVMNPLELVHLPKGGFDPTPR